MRCQCLTAKGNRCLRNSRPGEKFCGIHLNCRSSPLPAFKRSAKQIAVAKIKIKRQSKSTVLVNTTDPEKKREIDAKLTKVGYLLGSRKLNSKYFSFSALEEETGAFVSIELNDNQRKLDTPYIVPDSLKFFRLYIHSIQAGKSSGLVRKIMCRLIKKIVSVFSKEFICLENFTVYNSVTGELAFVSNSKEELFQWVEKSSKKNLRDTHLLLWKIPLNFDDIRYLRDFEEQDFNNYFNIVPFSRAGSTKPLSLDDGIALQACGEGPTGDRNYSVLTSMYMRMGFKPSGLENEEQLQSLLSKNVEEIQRADCQIYFTQTIRGILDWCEVYDS